MTLNEWEQSNIKVLTSREMGEWLGHRENRLLDKIRAEIDAIYKEDMECDGCSDMGMVLDIIDKYTGVRE